jgi:hydrogenase expression/formation protein HypC
MCLAIPSEIVEVREKMATVDVSGIRREVSLLLLPEEAAVGDFVLVHAGFAIHKIDREAAEEALKLISEIAENEEGFREERRAESKE